MGASTDIADLVDEAMAVLQHHALNAAAVDWSMARNAALNMVAPETIAGLGERLRTLVEALGDRHSFVLLPTEFEEMNSASTETPLDLPSSYLTARGVGVAVVPGLNAVDSRSPAAVAFAETLNRSIREITPSVTAGWVLDLRPNGGGNMHPMLAGLAGLLGAGPLCGFKDAAGDVAWVTADAEAVRIAGEIEATIPNAEHIESRRSAVLLGPATASSGEWTALCAISRMSARTFGTPTAGLLTGVELMELSNGIVLGVTTVSAVDHTAKAWPDTIEPDHHAPEDPLEDAVRWLLRE